MKKRADLLPAAVDQLADAVLRSANYHEKEYLVTVDRPVNPAFLKKMSSGVRILDQVTRPCRVSQTGERSFRIILTQGLNRQIRRMCEVFGCHVVRLVRIRIMNIMLGDLPAGKWRRLTGEEIAGLKKEAGRNGEWKWKRENTPG